MLGVKFTPGTFVWGMSLNPWQRGPARPGWTCGLGVASPRLLEAPLAAEERGEEVWSMVAVYPA